MKTYLMSFQVSHSNGGTSFASQIIESERPPTSWEVRQAEKDLAANHPVPATAAVVLAVSALGDE